MSDQPQFAKQLISKFPDQIEKRPWLYLEILKHNYEWWELIDFIKRLQIDFSADPAIQFALSYELSLCQYQLGDHFNAIKILKEIYAIDPDFRDVAILLQNWTNQNHA